MSEMTTYQRGYQDGITGSVNREMMNNSEYMRGWFDGNSQAVSNLEQLI